MRNACVVRVYVMKKKAKKKSFYAFHLLRVFFIEHVLLTKSKRLMESRKKKC